MLYTFYTSKTIPRKQRSWWEGVKRRSKYDEEDILLIEGEMFRIIFLRMPGDVTRRNRKQIDKIRTENETEDFITQNKRSQSEKCRTSDITSPKERREQN